MTRTITINVSEETERKFRIRARQKYGRRKGALGKAITEAINVWADKEEYDPDKHALAMLEKGFKMGKLKYKARAELDIVPLVSPRKTAFTNALHFSYLLPSLES